MMKTVTCDYNMMFVRRVSDALFPLCSEYLRRDIWLSGCQLWYFSWNINPARVWGHGNITRRMTLRVTETKRPSVPTKISLAPEERLKEEAGTQGHSSVVNRKRNQAIFLFLCDPLSPQGIPLPSWAFLWSPPRCHHSGYNRPTRYRTRPCRRRPSPPASPSLTWSWWSSVVSSLPLPSFFLTASHPDSSKTRWFYWIESTELTEALQGLLGHLSLCPCNLMWAELH